MYKSIKREIVELHQFFQNWYTGMIPSEKGGFDRLSSVLANNFSMVTPEGKLLKRDEVLTTVSEAHDAKSNLRIWIENVQVLHKIGEITLAIYEEWQLIGREVSVRLSSATFKFQPGAPNGLVWLHLHETWMHPPDQNPNESKNNQPDVYEPRYPHDRP